MSFDAERKMQFLYKLRSNGVTDARVLTAMERIDRAPFVQGLFSERAHEDTPLPIACGQTISQPSVVGLMTQALDVHPRHKVLEVVGILAAAVNQAIATELPLTATLGPFTGQPLIFQLSLKTGLGFDQFASLNLE